MLIWCLKQVKDFILKFPINEVSVDVHKIIIVLYTELFSFLLQVVVLMTYW